jgi:hypothetical protein
MNGRGKMTMPDGRVIEGEWRDNVKVENVTKNNNN